MFVNLAYCMVKVYWLWKTTARGILSLCLYTFNGNLLLEMQTQNTSTGWMPTESIYTKLLQLKLTVTPLDLKF